MAAGRIPNSTSPAVNPFQADTSGPDEAIDSGTAARIRMPTPGLTGDLNLRDAASAHLLLVRQAARLRQQVAARADYIVWLVKLVEFPNDQPVLPGEPTESAAIQLGVQDRLQALFNQVASHRPAPHPHIGLRWITNLSELAPANRELVIYFVATFMTGVIQPQLNNLRQNARTPQLRQHYERQYNSALPSSVGGGLPEDGLTFIVQPNDIRQNTDPPWSVSEVYVNVMIGRDFRGTFPRDPHLADWVPSMHNQVGCQIANVAFHEAMHNKINPAHPDNWDMHQHAGGGLAANTGYFTAATNVNIVQFAAQLNRAHPRQYVHGRDHLPNP